MDETFPEAVEADEEFDFLAPDEGADGFHVAFAAGALEQVAGPDFEGEVTQEGLHVADPAFGRCGDKMDLGGCWRFRGELGFYLKEDGCRPSR